MEKVDEIRRELTIQAPIETVWLAVSSADEVSQWFGDITEIDLRPGGKAKFGWTDDGDVFEAEVVAVERPFRFAYRWALEAGRSLEESLSTVVEFNLQPGEDGTRLTLVESGFSDLPDEHYAQHLGENSKGWTSELEDLRTYLAGVRPVA